jgi:hypothetical protein
MLIEAGQDIEDCQIDILKIGKDEYNFKKGF